MAEQDRLFFGGGWLTKDQADINAKKRQITVIGSGKVLNIGVAAMTFPNREPRGCGQRDQEG